MNIENLKEGDVVLTVDSYGYDVVKILKPLHSHPNYPFPVVQVLFVDSGDEDYLGGFEGYQPQFYTI